jgi:hypothetical protein
MLTYACLILAFPHFQAQAQIHAHMHEYAWSAGRDLQGEIFNKCLIYMHEYARKHTMHAYATHTPSLWRSRARAQPSTENYPSFETSHRLQFQLQKRAWDYERGTGEGGREGEWEGGGGGGEPRQNTRTRVHVHTSTHEPCLANAGGRDAGDPELREEEEEEETAAAEEEASSLAAVSTAPSRVCLWGFSLRGQACILRACDPDCALRVEVLAGLGQGWCPACVCACVRVCVCACVPRARAQGRVLSLRERAELSQLVERTSFSCDPRAPARGEDCGTGTGTGTSDLSLQTSLSYHTSLRRVSWSLLGCYSSLMSSCRYVS